MEWFKLSRRKHGMAITFLMSETLRYFDRALLFSAPRVYISMLYTRPREFKKPDSGIARRCFADGQKTANSPVECTVDFRDCNSSRRAIWSGPYDECRVCRVCERRGKMRVVSFSAGIFHRFRRGTRVRFKRVFLFFCEKDTRRFVRAVGSKFCGLFCFDKFTWQM